MDRIMTPDQLAAALLGPDAEPGHRRNKANVIRKQCTDGTIAHAEKEGTRWYINVTREFPALFPPEEPPQPRQASAIGADTTLAELLDLLELAARATA